MHMWTAVPDDRVVLFLKPRPVYFAGDVETILWKAKEPTPHM